MGKINITEEKNPDRKLRCFIRKYVYFTREFLGAVKLFMEKHFLKNEKVGNSKKKTINSMAAKKSKGRISQGSSFDFSIQR